MQQSFEHVPMGLKKRDDGPCLEEDRDRGLVEERASERSIVG